MKSNNYLLTIIFLIVALSASAQDKLISFQNDTLDVDLVELTPEFVRYQLWGEGGSIYKMSRDRVKEVVIRGSEKKAAEVVKHHNGPEIREIEGAFIVDGLGKRINSFWELEKYMLNDQISARHFYKAQSGRNVASVLGLGTLASFGYGVYKIRKHRDEYHDLFNPGLLVGEAFVYVITPLLATVTIVYVVKSHVSKKIAKDAYGIKSITEIELNKNLNILECRLGSTSDGVGLVFNF